MCVRQPSLERASTRGGSAAPPRHRMASINVCPPLAAVGHHRRPSANHECHMAHTRWRSRVARCHPQLARL